MPDPLDNAVETPRPTALGFDSPPTPSNDSNTSIASTADAPPGYEILEEVGRGGMGVVYRARAVALDRPVALKCVHVRRVAQPAGLSRFAHEARVTARLQHPGIPPVYEVGTLPDGRPFLAMKFIQGRSLDTLLREKGPGAGPWLGVFEAICQAVGYAHSQGIIHRDIKPANVMVGAFAEVQVMDWGLAKVLADGSSHGSDSDPLATTAEPSIAAPASGMETAVGTVLGTPAFMPPEQAIGAIERLDRRSDVFGLGGLLCALLTGKPPFVGSDGESTRHLAARAKLDDAFARLDGCGAEPELISLAKRCLSAEQDERPANAGVLAAEVARLRRRAEERAREAEMEQVRVTVEAREQQRRRRLWRIAAGLLAATLLAGIVGTTLGMIQARLAEKAERQAKVDAQGEKVRAEKAAVEATKAKQHAERESYAKEKALRKESQERRYAQAIADFVRFDFLALTSVDGQDRFGGEGRELLSKDTTLRELLDRAAAKLEKRKDLEPRTEADLRWMIGENYRGVGEYKRAVTFLEKCVSIRLKIHGETHSDTLVARHSLAQSYHGAGKVPEAIKLFEQDRNARVKKLGADHPSTLTTLNNLALAYHDAGKVPEAIKLHEQVRDARVKKLGADHPSTLTTLNNLALAYHDAGKVPEAIKLFEQVRDVRVKKLGADHSSTLTTLNNLAGAYHDAGKVPEAIKLHEQVRDARVKKLGADHPSTLNALTNLAWAYRAAGKVPEAIKLLEQVRDAQVKKLGADHPDTLRTLNILAGAYRGAGKLAEAIKLYEQVRDARVKKLGADHPSTLITLNNLAAAYHDAGKVPEAIKLFEQVRDARVKKLGADHPDTLNTLAALARAFRAADKLDEALPLFEQAARGIEKRRFLHQYASSILSNTIGAYEQAGKFDGAEQWQRKWLTFVKDRSGADSPAHAAELARLGRLLLRQKKWAEAEKPIRDSLAIREKKFPNDWSTFNISSRLGAALLGQKKYDEAEKSLLDGFEGMKKREKTIPPRSRIRLVEAVDRLIELYSATDRPDEVKKWRSERERYASRDEKQPKK